MSVDVALSVWVEYTACEGELYEGWSVEESAESMDNVEREGMERHGGLVLREGEERWDGRCDAEVKEY